MIISETFSNQVSGLSAQKICVRRPDTTAMHEQIFNVHALPIEKALEKWERAAFRQCIFRLQIPFIY
jgi:hypothetical protein